MQDKLLACVDWFIPSGSSSARSEMSLKRIFVATHLVGPTFSQSIGIYLLHADSNPNWIAYTIIAAIASFWLVPLVFKFSKNLEASAFLSFNLLAMTSFFGAFFYGGVSSPFLPWVIIALLLGFFYLSSRPLIVISCFAFWSFLFFIMHLGYGFPNRINLDKLQTLGWISISGAVTYMSWMAMFYSTVVSGRHDVELELTRHKLTAQRLQEAKSIAEAANKSRSIFLTKMSHELRTPLNAVIGYSELLVDTYEDEGASPQKTKDLLRISASGKHLLALVDQVLDLSKIESDVIDVHPSTMDLRAFADEIEATALPLTARNQNQFSMVLPTRPGLMNTDSTMVRQIMLNLISNAAKFTTKGQITLSINRIRVSGEEWLEFAVSDTGIGIAADVLPKLFTSFAQASAATSAQFGGTGIGLSVCRKFCNLLGGQIHATSQPGAGSKFTVRLPAVFKNDQSTDQTDLVQAGAPALGIAA
jgi:signal transduction histidine kinase